MSSDVRGALLVLGPFSGLEARLPQGGDPLEPPRRRLLPAALQVEGVPDIPFEPQDPRCGGLDPDQKHDGSTSVQSVPVAERMSVLNGYYSTETSFFKMWSDLIGKAKNRGLDVI